MTLPVLIVGAGPVGLTLACLLAQLNVPLRIIDSSPHPTTLSRATDLHARTIELLSIAGLASPFLQHGVRSSGIRFSNHLGHTVSHIRTQDLDSPFPFILGVPQSDTERFLCDALQHYGVHVERNTQLLHFTQDHNGVHALLQRPTGAREALHTHILAGCDGAHSTTRSLLNLPFQGLSYSESFLLADVDLTWDLPRDQIEVSFSPNGFLNVLPMPGTHSVRLFANLPPDQDHLQPTLDTFQHLLKTRHAQPAQLSNPGWMARFHIHRRIVPNYRTKRVFLLGDAAHIHSPVGGMGMNTGIQDSFNLAWKIALVHHKYADPNGPLLDSYHDERHTIGSHTLLKTDIATRMSMLRHPSLSTIRDQLSPLLSTLPGVSSWLPNIISTLDVHIRHSPIVRAHQSSLLRAELTRNPSNEHASVQDWFEFGWGPEAGDRAPARVFGTPQQRRPFTTVLSPTTHTLLLFDGAATTDDGYTHLLQLARRAHDLLHPIVTTHIVIPRTDIPPLLRPWDRILLDPQGDLHCAFGARAECMVLIRPDGYIGLRSQPATFQTLSSFAQHLKLYSPPSFS